MILAWKKKKQHYYLKIRKQEEYIRQPLASEKSKIFQSKARGHILLPIIEKRKCYPGGKGNDAP